MKEKKIKKVFLENLPRKPKGKVIDWFACKNHRVRFIYNNIEGWIRITDIKREDGKTMLGIKYLDEDIFYMFTGHFANCQLGEILGINTTKHYYKVGDIIEVSTGKIKIKALTRDKDNKKDYVFKCLKCGWENGRINEGNLKKKQGCGCCSNKVPIMGINTIEITDSWMLKYFKNPKDAETHTYGSQDKDLLYCPICKTSKDIAIAILHRDKTVNCEVCKDGFSYGEKFTYNLYKQLNIKAKRHKYFDWSKNVYSEIDSLCGNKEYDFHFELNGENYITETNGLQHYQECSFSRRSYFEESENDKLKEKLALDNGIKEENYIVIDCRYSNFEFIKQNILNNKKIINKFDLSNIDWLQCEKEALSSYLVKACEYFNQGVGHMEIAKIMDIDFKTVKRYLKRVREFGLCDYKTADEIRNKNIEETIKMWIQGIHNASEIGRQLGLDDSVIGDYLRQAEKDNLIEYKKYIRDASSKQIKSIEYNKEFISINEAHRVSKDIFGIDLSRKGITKSCDTGEAYKGLHFQYI